MILRRRRRLCLYVCHSPPPTSPPLLWISCSVLANETNESVRAVRMANFIGVKIRSVSDDWFGLRAPCAPLLYTTQEPNDGRARNVEELSVFNFLSVCSVCE